MLGYESEVVNGQLVNVAPRAAYDPLIFGAAFTGPGMWPRQGVYTVPPVTPSPSQMGEASPQSWGGSFTNFPTVTNEQGNPYSLTKSPLWWALGFLVVSLLMLHFIHYK